MPVHIQYVRYINDLSPLSLNHSSDGHFLYLDEEKYDVLFDIEMGSWHLERNEAVAGEGVLGKEMTVLLDGRSGVATVTEARQDAEECIVGLW